MSSSPCTPLVAWKIAGTISPIALSVSAVAPRPAAVALNCSRWKRRPPPSSARPSTSRMLPMIDPVIDAFTTPM